MAVRDMVEIDEDLCDGCGDCVPTCAEGAIQIIDGKARLVSDVLCDGLGACLGHCPQGAITVVRREADPYDEEAVAAHLSSIRGAPSAVIRPQRGNVAVLPMAAAQMPAPACPGSRAASWSAPSAAAAPVDEDLPSSLRQWPVQLHLLPPSAPFLKDAEVLLAADCVAFAVGGFHRRFLKGRALAIACPKLDSHQEIYVEKLATMIDTAGIRELSVMVMEVPCCSGLVRLAQEAMARSQRSVPARVTVVGVRGEIMGERML